MEKELIEQKRNELNIEIRYLLTVIDMIDDKKREYEDYESNSLDEIGFIDQQINLIKEAKTRLINIFKD